jgi:hypothetical protein
VCRSVATESRPGRPVTERRRCSTPCSRAGKNGPAQAGFGEAAVLARTTAAARR